MTDAVLVAPFALPILAAAVGVVCYRHRLAQRLVTAALLASLLAVGVSLIVTTADGAAMATRVGNWPQGLAIVFAADGLSALLMVAMTMAATLAVVFAVGRGEDAHPLFHPMTAVLLSGALGSLVTADLFNLFVTFEVMLIASYVLLALRAGRREVRAGTIYIAVNLAASTAFLLGVALVYATAGTVRFADLPAAMSQYPGTAVGMTLIIAAAAIKAGLVPMHAWLPRVYVKAGPAVTALLAALLTKAGVYVLLRMSSLVVGDAPAVRQVFLVVAVATMVLGVIAAIGQDDIRAILAFHMVSQVGYLILPLGIWTTAGITAAIFYMVQYTSVKSSLFLTAGAISAASGTSRLSRLGGLASSRPLLAVGFLLPAAALAGLPPLSGFVGKFMLIRAAFLDHQWLAGGAAVAVSLFTLMSMLKIWNGAFWGAAPDRTGEASSVDELPANPSPQSAMTMVAPTLVVSIAVVALGIGAEWLIGLVAPAAEGLLDPTTYLEAMRTS